MGSAIRTWTLGLLLTTGGAPAAERAPEVPATLGGIPLRAHNDFARIYSELELNFDHLGRIAVRTRLRVSAWLQVEPVRGRPVDVFLVGAPDELRRLEQELGLPSAGSWRQWANGGYFHSHRAMALVVAPGRSTEWLVSHEMWHSVFRDVAQRHPVALNEGLAEVLPSWILYGRTRRPEDNLATYRDYEPVLVKLVENGDVPPLEEFVQWDSDRFHTDRWASFSLAWCLGKMLVESRHPGLQGKLPRLIGHLGTNKTTWQDFSDVYDAELLEQLWSSWTARVARRARRR